MEKTLGDLERINCPVSTKELERRWAAVRKEMKERGIDVLIIRNNIDIEGGTDVKWFTDLPAVNGVPFLILFKVDEDMTVISRGPLPPDEPRWPGPPYALRGVSRQLNSPYSDGEAKLAVQELNMRGKCCIGWVGLAQIPATVYNYLTANLLQAHFVDATDMVDAIKVIKSEEEIELIKKAAAVADEGMRAVIDSVKPGMKDCDVYAEAQRRLVKLGSEQQLLMLASGPYGRPVPTLLTRHFMQRKLQDGDQLNFMVEANGPGGMWTELGRAICIGKVSKELEAAWEVARSAQHFAASLLKPGADPKDIYDRFNAYLIDKGYPSERRMFAHAQGYGAGERPVIRDEETMKIRANMNIAIHPTATNEKARAWCSDNYLVGESGVNERVHKIPQEIFVV